MIDKDFIRTQGFEPLHPYYQALQNCRSPLRIKIIFHSASNDRIFLLDETYFSCATVVTLYVQVWNGRLAMLAFATVLFVEGFKNGPGLVL